MLENGLSTEVLSTATIKLGKLEEKKLTRHKQSHKQSFKLSTILDRKITRNPEKRSRVWRIYHARLFLLYVQFRYLCDDLTTSIVVSIFIWIHKDSFGKSWLFGFWKTHNLFLSGVVYHVCVWIFTKIYWNIKKQYVIFKQTLIFGVFKLILIEGMMVVEPNMAKYEAYKTMHEDLKKAIRAGFYYQAIFT